MASHMFHPDTHTAGLYDACKRCQQHAKHPMGSLDNDNIDRLRTGKVYTELDIQAAQAIADWDASQGVAE